jgi:hypothetical protein
MEHSSLFLLSDYGRVIDERLIRFIITDMLGNRLPLINATQFEICFTAPHTLYVTKYSTTEYGKNCLMQWEKYRHLKEDFYFHCLKSVRSFIKKN